MARGPLREGDPFRIGRYRLTARLGAGGMGLVYLGEAEDGSQVAVKVLRPELADDAEFRARFSREVATLTRVSGVCTVRVIEADTDSARPFLVTEYVDGLSLAEYTATDGPLGDDGRCAIGKLLLDRYPADRAGAHPLIRPPQLMSADHRLFLGLGTG